MFTQHLYRRLTHKYVDSCRHLDNHVFLGSVRCTAPRETRPAENYDDGGTFTFYATLPPGLTRRQRQVWRDTLAENVSKHGCTHEHDCCGCMSVSARAHPTHDPRRVLVRYDVGYNY